MALQLLADLEPQEEEEAQPVPRSRQQHGGRRPGAGRSWRKGRGRSAVRNANAVRGRGRGQASKRVSKHDRLFNLQADALNQGGRARTADHLVVAHGQKRKKILGKGQWKRWTPQALLRAAFGDEVASQRDVAQQIDGAGHRQSADARYVVASAVMSGQQRGLESLRSLPLDFYIRNIMWDETTFDLTWEKGKAAATHSVLCSHAQVSYRVNEAQADVLQEHGPGVRDQHVIRVPQILPRYNAGTVSGALHRLPGGLQDVAEAPLCATLASCDAHAANLKCLRQLHCKLPKHHMLLISVCAQHRAANVVEALTKAVGNLTGVFCLSKVFNYQNVLIHLQQHLKARLEAVVHRVCEPPLAQRENWRQGAVAARELVRLCLACQEPSETNKKSPMEELLDFFPGPWTGLTVCSGFKWLA